MTSNTSVRCTLRPLALAAAALFASQPQAAGPAAPAAPATTTLPSGLQVVQGQAQLAQQGSRLTVSNSANAILNWQQFSIGSGAAVHFAQPDASSRVLNRVTGADPSAIFGGLSSNGQVWLLNPNGVLFGASARIDVAGLVASTLAIGDADWTARRWTLAAPAGLAAAEVVNQGELLTPLGGRVLLLGSAGVRNEGLIHAPDGQVLLAAGQQLTLADTALPNLAISVVAPQGEALNLGRVLAGSGRIDLQAAIVNQQGIVRADSLSGSGGQVQLTGSQAVNLGATSLTSASGASGGVVGADAGAAGTLLAAGRIEALGTQGTGGQVTLTGHHVGIVGQALVDASGSAGGGSLRVGGGLQGRDAGVRNAQAVFLAPSATLRADALLQGDGGSIVLWGDAANRSYGHLSAQGGPQGGDGGLIETSGGWLDARPASLSTAAPAGRAGLWLLDPADILISDNVGDSGISGSPNFLATASTALLSTATLNAALSAGNNVVVSTHDASGELNGNGDILVVNATIRSTSATPVSLSLLADRNISIDYSSLRSEGAALSLLLSAARGDGYGYGNDYGEYFSARMRAAGLAAPPVVASETGLLGQYGAIAIRSSTLHTGGGDIALGGLGASCGYISCAGAASNSLGLQAGAVAVDGLGLSNGVLVSASTLDAGSGSISMVGHSTVQATETAGIAITDGSTLSASRISLLGTVEASSNYARTGVKLAGGPAIASQLLEVTGAAYSAWYAPLAQPVGVDILGELRIGGGSDGVPQLLISGETQDGPRSDGEVGALLPRFGVGMRGEGARIVASGGAVVTLSGRDLSGNGDPGLLLAGTAATAIDAAAASSLTLESNSQLMLSSNLVAPSGGSLLLRADSLLQIEAASLSGNPATAWLKAPMLAIGVGGETTRLAFGSNTQLTLAAYNLSLGAYDFGQNQGTSLRGPDRSSLATTDNGEGSSEPIASAPSARTTLAAGGLITLAADSLLIGASTTVHSTAAGQAIVLAGSPFSEGNGSLQFLSNQAGIQALSAPNGRWLVYAQDSEAGDSPLFEHGGLRPAFRQYNAGAGSTPAAEGNAFLFAAAPLLGLDSPYQRVYDGSITADLASVELSPSGLKPGVLLDGSLVFADKNVGSAKPLLLVAQGNGTGFVHSDGTPVYGYRLDSASLVGDITPRAVGIGAVQAFDKVYDGSTQATLGGITLTGVLGQDQVGASAGSGQFDSRHAGQGKTVFVSGITLAGADAGNYAFFAGEGGASSSTSASTTASILARSISATGTASDKVYDGGTAASVGSTLTLSGVLEGDLVSGSASSGQFLDKRVGQGKTVLLGGLALAGDDASNYRLESASASASITPRSLGISAASVADRVYDGTAQARSATVALSGVLEGDSVTAQGSGRFADANVGQAKTVSLTDFVLGGADGGNYRISIEGAVVASAAITPATLRYVAAPVSVVQGAALPALTGTVSGFVGEDTLASATTGTLLFSAATATNAAPGQYAINGSGLSAANYSFSQASGNAVALSITPAPVVVSTVSDTPQVTQTAVVSVLPPPVLSSATEGRTLDAVQVLGAGTGGAGEGRSFASLDLSNMSQDSVATVLAAREQYKKTVFAQALAKLEQNPALADAPGCATAEQAASGQCLMFSPLPGGSAAAGTAPRATVQLSPLAPPPAPAAAPAPTPAPAAAPAAAPAVAAAAAPAARQAAVAARAARPAPRLPTASAVKTASLPQIRRKLAVLIGIDQYTDAKIPRLANAVGDARAVAEALQSKLGYDTLVLENPDRATVYAALNQLAGSVGPEDSVVLYYAGHGELVDKTGQGYWQPADADATRPETWISNADIGRLLRQLPAQQLAMISDSCFSGSLVSGERIRSTGGSSGQDANALLSRRAAVVMSSGGNEPVFDSGKNGHSPFAWSLMQSLGQVSAWKPGASVFEQVRFQVARQLPQRPQYGASRDGGHEAGADYLFEQRQIEGRKP